MYRHRINTTDTSRTRYIDVTFVRLTLTCVRDVPYGDCGTCSPVLSALPLGVATVWWGAFSTRKRGKYEYITAWSRPSHSALSRFNYDASATPSWSRWSPLKSMVFFLQLIHYFTLWSWPLTFGLQHLQCIARDVMKLCTKFESNRAIRGGLRFEYLTQWPNLNVL